MDFTWTEEQDALRGAVRGLLVKHYDSTESRRNTVAAEPGYDTRTWSLLADLGALGLPFSEEVGGVAAGPIEIAIVAEEIGRALASEPFAEAVVLAGGLVAEAGSLQQQKELISALASGACLVVFAGLEPGRRWQIEPVHTRAVLGREGWRLTGVKEPVVFGAQADVLVVSATVDGSTCLFLVSSDADGLSRAGYTTHDGTRAAVVKFEDTPAIPLGEPGADCAAVIETVWDRARLAHAHELLGALEHLVTTTTEYLKARRQFGVPLNTFQALSHRAAEMYVALELARSTITWATIVRDAEHNGDWTVDVASATSQAWLQAGRAARLIGQESIQMHGGIGVTAEYGIGHYVSRLTTLERLAGDAAFHRARLFLNLDDHQSVDPMG